MKCSSSSLQNLPYQICGERKILPDARMWDTHPQDESPFWNKVSLGSISDKYLCIGIDNETGIKLGPIKHFKILYTNSYLDYIRMRCFAVKISSATTHPKVRSANFNWFLCNIDVEIRIRRVKLGNSAPYLRVYIVAIVSFIRRTVQQLQRRKGEKILLWRWRVLHINPVFWVQWCCEWSQKRSRVRAYVARAEEHISKTYLQF